MEGDAVEDGKPRSNDGDSLLSEIIEAGRFETVLEEPLSTLIWLSDGKMEEGNTAADGKGDGSTTTVEKITTTEYVTELTTPSQVPNNG
jgi:hypothetical protein